MIWAAAFIALLLIISSPRLRNYVLVAVVIGAAAYFILQYRSQMEEGRARALIKASELKLDELRFTSVKFTNEISGRVTNTSAHVLEEFDLRLTFRDCPQEGKDEACTSLGAGTAGIHMEVPPGETRSFAGGVWTSEELHAKGRLDWSWQIGTIKGRL